MLDYFLAGFFLDQSDFSWKILSLGFVYDMVPDDFGADLIKLTTLFTSVGFFFLLELDISQG